LKTIEFPPWLLAAALMLPIGATAQVVPVKTVPVASGDQFLFFPSRHLAMGSVGLALADTLGDPFGNPATAARLAESVFFGSPSFYSISQSNGSARTLPLGALFTSGGWFGGGALALQELEGAQRDRIWRWMAPEPAWDWIGPPAWETLSERSARNLYAFGLLGRRFPERGLSIGLSGFWGDMRGVDGVDLLYAMSQEIRQSGHLSSLRLGILKEWEGGRSLEAVLLRERVRMRHDVSYLDMVWRPRPPDTIPMPAWETRVEKNLDHTDTWGAQLAYRRPLQAPGWTVGWSATANRKDHPKIPNYEIQNIPRDPGETWAFSFGAGLALADGPFRFGADVFLEPIWSETWADAARDTTAANGKVIPAGDPTVENDFRFLNALVRAGGSYRYRWATLMMGLQIRSVAYELEQLDRIALSDREQDEGWMEWSPSLGMSLELGRATLHYSGRVTTGTGRPGTQWTAARMAESGAVDLMAADFLLAPQGPLTLQEAQVTTHQIALVIPIR
jgi:hypothetical protein